VRQIAASAASAAQPAHTRTGSFVRRRNLCTRSPAFR